MEKTEQERHVRDITQRERDLSLLTDLVVQEDLRAASLSLYDLRKANMARNEEWNTGSEPVSLTFRTTEIAGELGELCEGIKKAERLRLGIRGGAEMTEKEIDEFADVIIAVDLLAMDLGLDLSEIIRRKFNKTSEKHTMQTRL